MPEPSLRKSSTDPKPAAAATPKPAPRRDPPGRILPFAAGVAAGLLMSGFAALYILNSPLPFVDKGLRKAEPVVKKAPAPAPEAEPETPPAVAEPAPSQEQVAKPAQTPPAEPLGTVYFLQVAAFRSSQEADQMRARLAILGFEAAITQTRRDNDVLHRVRLGPFAQFDEVNRVKAALAESSVEATVIRVLPE